MLMLQFIPDSIITWFVHCVLLSGIVLFAISLLGTKLLGVWYLLVRVIGIILLLAGIFFEGGLQTELQWRAKVKELETKVAQAEQKAKKINKTLSVVVKQKEKVIKGRQNEIKKAIQKNREAIDAECRLSYDAWLFYNRSSQNPIPRSTFGIDDTSNKSKTTK